MTEQPAPYSANADPASERITRRILERVARYAEDDPASMAALLKRFAQIEGLFSDERLAASLGIAPAGLPRLRLCQRPDSASPHFGQQVKQVAAWSGIEETRLANLVRQVEAVDAMRAAGAARTHGAQSAHGAHLLRPALLAARDRMEADEPGALHEGRSDAYAAPAAQPPADESAAAAPPDPDAAAPPDAGRAGPE